MMAPRNAVPFTPAPPATPPRTGRRSSRSWRECGVEALESRELLSTFTVTNRNGAGVGSLRWAIDRSNVNPGPDAINFAVVGTIQAGRTSLPSIVGTVAINGASAPGYAGAPRVTVDFQGTRGLRFERGSDGSTLTGLSLVRAGTAGVTLVSSHNTLQGNYIGLLADGRTVAGNRGDGVQITSSSHDNLIGRRDPVTSISYFNTAAVPTQPVSGWQGVRNGASAGQFLLAGTSQANGLLYVGPISGVGGTTYLVNYPGAKSTSVYGPDLLEGGRIRLVGSYKDGDDVVRGFLFEGTTAELNDAGRYRTIVYPNSQFNYVHSTMGGLAVGNADGPEGNLPIGTGHAFLYDIGRDAFLPDIVFPGSTSTSAYGIWYNGGTKYTITGGYSKLGPGGRALGQGFLVDYDKATGQFSNWASFDYPNGAGRDVLTHFEGISSTEKGVYTLSADSIPLGSPQVASWVSVRRNPNGTFGPAAWVDLNYPGIAPGSAFTSNDSVAGNSSVGIVAGPGGAFSFQATVNIGFQRSNVISGNRGNGIGIYGGDDNQIAMNFIGSDASGTRSRGNSQNGIFLTQGASHNLIGGQATGGNNPTGGVFVRPPQGNLISGNHRNGVLINNFSTLNLLSGNFIGTTESGNNPLGNWADGVAIVNSSGNQLIGCTFQQSPFVFYNVISGNGHNGVRVTNSNNTVIQANFLGAGANNATVVPNGSNGLLVSGTSRNTQVGGVIPLGNVISGNNLNGIEVRDRASGFISFNTFAGLFAFSTAAPNKRDGILITSTGGNNQVRTSIVSGNLGDGIEIGGNATGVQVFDTAVGTNTSIQTALPNRGSGIKFSGNAHGNVIGGFRPSVEPEVTISSNGGYGIEFVGSAHHNFVFHTFLGTTAEDTGNLGNRLGGILLGAGTSSNTIGGNAPILANKIRNSLGNGVTILGSRNNAVLQNEITDNRGYGLFAAGVCNGTVVRNNTIQSNARGNVNLSRSRGIVFIP